MHWHSNLLHPHVVHDYSHTCRSEGSIIKHLKLIKHAKHVTAKESFQGFFFCWARLWLCFMFLNYKYEYYVIVPAAGNICLFILSCIMAPWWVMWVGLKCDYTDVQVIKSNVGVAIFHFLGSFAKFPQILFLSSQALKRFRKFAYLPRVW